MEFRNIDYEINTINGLNKDLLSAYVAELLRKWTHVNTYATAKYLSFDDLGVRSGDFVKFVRNGVFSSGGFVLTVESLRMYIQCGIDKCFVDYADLDYLIVIDYGMSQRIDSVLPPLTFERTNPTAFPSVDPSGRVVMYSKTAADRKRFEKTKTFQQITAGAQWNFSPV